MCRYFGTKSSRAGQSWDSHVGVETQERCRPLMQHTAHSVSHVVYRFNPRLNQLEGYRLVLGSRRLRQKGRKKVWPINKSEKNGE